MSSGQSHQTRVELDELPELVSVALTAEFMGLTESQVRTLLRSRRLEHVEIGHRKFIPKTAIPRSICASGQD
jgi:hypothetical protein